MSVEDRLTKLETKFEERWDAHDKRSDEIWAEIRRDLKEIKDNLNQRVNGVDKIIQGLQCDVHHERIKNLSTKVNWIYGMIAGIIAAIVGVVFKK